MATSNELPGQLEKGAVIHAYPAVFRGSEMTTRKDRGRVLGVLKRDNRDTNGILTLISLREETELCSPEGAKLLQDDELTPDQLEAVASCRKRYAHELREGR